MHCNCLLFSVISKAQTSVRNVSQAFSVVSGFTPVTYPTKVSSECGQCDALTPNPPKNRSCQEILHCFPSAVSGYYQITARNGSLVNVYCDMEGTNCGEGGWTRVAYVNMSQSGATCPQGLTQRTLSGLTLCGRNSSGCQSTVFFTLGLDYSRVCGQLRGYQLGLPDAFQPYFNSPSTIAIDSLYVDGVSITYGSAPRKHIWTYANGVNLKLSGDDQSVNCPCNNTNGIVPPYVGSDYYCETGNNGYTCCNNSILYSNDPLWDGQQCPSEEAPCCTHPNMLWLTRHSVRPLLKTLN